MAARHIEACKKHISEQQRRVRELERRGEDTSRSRGLLELLEDSLALHQLHRANIERALRNDIIWNVAPR